MATALEAPGRALRGPGLRSLLGSVGIVVGGVVGIVALWQAAIVVFDFPPYLLPRPWDVALSFWRGVTAPIDSTSSLLYHLGMTMRAAVGGLILGAVSGIVVGAIAATSKIIDDVVSPYVFALQGMPKIAFAPLLMVWVGFGVTSKTLLAAFLVFFPLFVNTYTAVSQRDRNRERLFSSLGATRRQKLMQLRLPESLVLIFAGLELGMVEALIGAIVGEFIAADVGIGSLLTKYQALANTSAIFAGLMLLGLTGVLLNFATRYLRRKVVYWRPE